MKFSTSLAIIFVLFGISLFAQDPVPCELPYPQVTDLTVVLTEESADFSYTPIEGALACRFRLKKVEPFNSPTQFAVDTLPGLGSYSISGDNLEYQTLYQASVSCGCSDDPVIFGPYSSTLIFFSGATGKIVPCENPYPQAANPDEAPTEALDGFRLKWDAIPQSGGCQIEYSASEGPSQAVLINGLALGEYVIPESELVMNTSYSWRVRCGCQWDPLVAGPWSQQGFFFTDQVGTLEGYAPEARFIAVPLAPVAGTAIEFRDQSIYEPTSWLWDFGDGSISTEQNPTHTYSSEGNYTVTLTATNSSGSGEGTRVEYIQVFAPNCPASVTDVQGTAYSVVQLGNTCWTGENIVTTTFNNGDEIPNVVPFEEWMATTAPAYSNYDDDTALGDTIGRLYNGYVILDSRNVCPAGWHVPVESEWLAMEELLGMDSVDLNVIASARGDNRNIGGQLKSQSSWSPFNIGGRDSYGMTILPAGYRFFVFLDFVGIQSLSRYNVVNDLAVGPQLRYREFSYLSRGISREEAQPIQGASIRCVQD